MGEFIGVGPASEQAYLAIPAGGAGPGVLVLHAWWGLTSTFTGVCDRLAEAGFVALAPSVFRDGATAATVPEAEALLQSVESDDAGLQRIQGLVKSALDHLRGLPQARGGAVGAVGYSMGGWWSGYLARERPDEVGAVVWYYGTGGGDFRASRAAYLGHFAERDEYEPLEAVRELEARIRDAGRDVTFHVYPGTDHWFVEPDRPEYDAPAAELAWQRTVTFLRERLPVS